MSIVLVAVVTIVFVRVVVAAVAVVAAPFMLVLLLCSNACPVLFLSKYLRV